MSWGDHNLVRANWTAAEWVQTLKFNPNHDSRGRFSNRQGMVSHLGLHGERDGGFTVSPTTGREPKAGFAVATHPQNEKIVSDSVLHSKAGRAALIDSYLKEHEAEFKADSRLHVGGWHDADTHRFVLDTVTVEPSRSRAVALGRRTSQDAIFDLHSGQEVTLRAADQRDRLAKALAHGVALAEPLDVAGRGGRVLRGSPRGDGGGVAGGRHRLSQAAPGLARALGFVRVLKFNQNHDRLGRFSSSGGFRGADGLEQQGYNAATGNVAHTGNTEDNRQRFLNAREAFENSPYNGPAMNTFDRNADPSVSHISAPTRNTKFTGADDGIALHDWAAQFPPGTAFRALNRHEVDRISHGGLIGDKHTEEATATAGATHTVVDHGNAVAIRGGAWVSDTAKTEYLDRGEVIAAVNVTGLRVITPGMGSDRMVEPISSDRLLGTWNPGSSFSPVPPMARGRGIVEGYPATGTPIPAPTAVAKAWEMVAVLKFNPAHDAHGRFATSAGTHGPGNYIANLPPAFAQAADAWSGSERTAVATQNAAERILTGGAQDATGKPWYNANDRRARALLDGIGDHPGDAPELYRGLKMSDANWEAWSKPGSTHDIALASFSSDRKMAQAFASTKMDDINDAVAGHRHRPVELRLQPGSQSIGIQQFSEFKTEAEWLSSGRFEVVGVSNRTVIPTITLRQLGTFDLPPAP